MVITKFTDTYELILPDLRSWVDGVEWPMSRVVLLSAAFFSGRMWVVYLHAVHTL